MKTIKLLIIAVVTTLAFNTASAQIHLPPPPPRPPAPPRLHIKAPPFMRAKRHRTYHRSSRKIVLHAPPRPRLPGGPPPPPRPPRP